MLTIQNDKPDVTSAELAEQVKDPRGIFTGFILADYRQKINRRGEALSRVYEYILSDAWGKP
jgi:hypothetical protein